MRLEDSHPLVVEKTRQLLELDQTDGIEILVTSTLSTLEEQAELYAIGQAKPGEKVTKDNHFAFHLNLRLAQAH